MLTRENILPLPLLLPANTRRRVVDAFSLQGVDWETLKELLPIVAAAAETQQNLHYHPEGDVLTHSQLAIEELLRLDPNVDLDLIYATAFHDIGKVVTTTEVNGVLRSPHHSDAGASIISALLWRLQPLGVNPLRVSKLIRWHMRPPFLANSLDLQSCAHIAADLAIASSSWKELLTLSIADYQGRGNHANTSSDNSAYREKLDLLELFLEEHGLLVGEYEFASPESRYISLSRSWSPHIAYPARERKLIMLSGLPASGKSTYAKSLNMPIVSYDEVRAGLQGRGQQLSGRVRQESQRLIKKHLVNDGAVCVDATFLTKQARQPVLRIADDYSATIEIHNLSTTPEKTRARNREREASVPEEAILRMLERWQLPVAADAHIIKYIST